MRRGLSRSVKVTKAYGKANVVHRKTVTVTQTRDIEAAAQARYYMDIADFSFTIRTVDIFTLSTSAHIPCSADVTSVAEALVQAGFLGNSPINPSISVSFRTLEHYHFLCLWKPSFSVEAFAKVLCDSYQMPYRRTYRTILADTFDLYLSICREVDAQVDASLGRDTPNWHVLNACPACTFTLEDEPLLKFKRMYVMDGGNSTKSMANTQEEGDTCDYTSDYLLPKTFIDTFAHEVKTIAGDEKDDEGLTVGKSVAETIASDCSKNWKAAAVDEKKRMWAIFDEMGIFVSACRHGLVLWYTDMIRSGELAKYPLAIVAKVLTATISSSSLGPEFATLSSQMCVDSFHGYAHNYVCQTKNHPLGISGAGLEDFGATEHIFSASNALPPVIRYASRYRRHVFIDLFFKPWDDKKYINLGTMLLDNYHQALCILTSEKLALEEAKRVLSIEDGDLNQWREEEVACFNVVRKEDDWDIHAVMYVEMLQELCEVEYFITSVPKNYEFRPPGSVQGSRSTQTYENELSQMHKLETKRQVANERVDNLRREVITLELKLGITSHWQPSSPEYEQTLKYVSKRNFRKRLDMLRHLVVQCLFELQKLNVSQTAYKMRTHISKSLQTQCRAIQNAVKAYNSAAAALTPPRPPLEWSKVSHYAFLEEFDLLCQASHETIRQYLRIQRAEEEIVRCNVEVRQLHTAILSENEAFVSIITRLRESGSQILLAVEEFCTYRHRINTQLLSKIHQIHALEVRVGTTLRTHTTTSTTTTSVGGYEDENEEDGEDHDDEVARDVDCLVDYISDLVLH
ncbi:hypothetical protein BU15DRAFT_90967 [Melanogaster broomeanus]|nr:hypothetical protein BU15DRAFT_90967 [Melanogaster broomeanus]